MATDLTTLLDQSKCFTCLGMSIYEGLSLALLAQIANNGGGGGGGGSLPALNTGDLLVGSGVNTLTTISDVATGNALISGGVGVAPSYGKIGLTTHVTGILAVPNGGTGANSFASGDVLFGNGAGALGVSSNLAWDNTNKKLTVTNGGQTITLDPGTVGTQGTGGLFINATAGGAIMNIVTSGADPYVYMQGNSVLGLFGLRTATGALFFQHQNVAGAYFGVELAGGGMGRLSCGIIAMSDMPDITASLYVNNLVAYWLRVNGGDNSSTPSNPAAPFGYLLTRIDNVDSWIPYFQ